MVIIYGGSNLVRLFCSSQCGTRKKKCCNVWNKVWPKYLWQVIWRQTNKWKSLCCCVLHLHPQHFDHHIFLSSHRKAVNYRCRLKNSASWTKTFIQFAPPHQFISLLELRVKNLESGFLNLPTPHFLILICWGQFLVFRECKNKCSWLFRKYCSIWRKLSPSTTLTGIYILTFSNLRERKHWEEREKWIVIEKKKQFLESSELPVWLPGGQS